MLPDKKQVEILLMQYFRKCYLAFPKGKLVPSESPDFILKVNTKTGIGIELTRLNPLHAYLPDKIQMERYYLKQRIINSVKSLFVQTSTLKLFVKFQYSENIPIEEERELSVVARVVNKIRQAVQFKKASDFFYLILSKKILPTGFESILIINHPALEIDIWEHCNNIGFSQDIVGEIHEAIRKKEEKLRLYYSQNLHSYWLVIVTESLSRLNNYNTHDRIMSYDFESRYQNVFLFDLIKSKVLQIV